MIDSVASHILALPAWVAILVVFLLPALESSAFVGFVFPGEIALILGGVLAYQGRVPLPAVLAAGILGAVVGDSVGYLVGRRWGRRVLDGSLGRFVKAEHLDRGERYLRERGGNAVFLGRFTAALRVTIPSLAGMSRLRYSTFAAYNVAGGVLWASMAILLGYLGGSSWQHVEHLASRIGLGALVFVLLVAAVVYLVRHGHGRRVVDRLTSSGAVRRARARYPRTTAWVAARFEPGRDAGLGMSVAVVTAVVAVWIFLGITQDVVAHEEIARNDPAIHAWVLSHRTAVLSGFFRAVTWLGASAVTIPLLVLVGGALAWMRRSWRPVVSIVVVYGAAVLGHAIVEIAVRRPRPPAGDWLASASGWSYPSGHTIQAVAAWGVLALLVAPQLRTRARRTAVVAVAVVVSVLVAASRVYLGVHWATDVAGSATAGVAILATWCAVRRAWTARIETTGAAA